MYRNYTLKMRFNISVILSIAFLACGINAELTSSQKKTLLSLHKEARAKLNASNMKSISWSDSLASAAQVIILYITILNYIDDHNYN